MPESHAGLSKFPPIKNRTDAKYWHVYDAVADLNGRASLNEIKSWLASHYPEENLIDVGANASLLSVNDHNRYHYDKSRKSFRSDQGNNRDVLFREKQFNTVIFTIYFPEKHGIWDIRQNKNGKREAYEVISISEALHQVHQQIAAERPTAIEGDYDSRIWDLRAVALREGQRDFRNALLHAYEGKCAVTGSSAVEILEAAHIRPYLGSHTDRADNGLLLRADIHTLFDKGLIFIDHENCIQINECLLNSEYAQYQGKPIYLPKILAQRPHPDHLAHHRLSITGKMF